MANAYLINAMYGPRPKNPFVSKVESSSDDSANTQDRISLAERLYGRSSSATGPSISQAHDEQEQYCDTECEVNTAGSQPEPWKPTGANITPVAIYSAETPRFSSLRSMQTSTTQQPAKSRTQLRLPVEQYLPPPGAYYDQFSLALVLDIAFANDKCWCCWRSRKKCTMFAACTKACRVCHTSNHAGTTCPLLYCTPSWFRDRSADNRGPEIRAEARQFRPTRVELEVLKTMGVVLQTTRHDTPIRPNMAHALVQGFYRNKDAPNPVTTPYSGNKTTAPNIGRESLMRSDAPLSMPKLPEQQATMSLDPRLQGRFAYTTIDAAVPPAWFGVADTATEDEKQRNSECEVERDGEMEVRLQELEDEVLRLKIDNVAKDREIRRLKSENDKLRGTAHETGNKRQRV